MSVQKGCAQEWKVGSRMGRELDGRARQWQQSVNACKAMRQCRGGVSKGRVVRVKRGVGRAPCVLCSSVAVQLWVGSRWWLLAVRGACLRDASGDEGRRGKEREGDGRDRAEPHGTFVASRLRRLGLSRTQARLAVDALAGQRK